MSAGLAARPEPTGALAPAWLQLVRASVPDASAVRGMLDAMGHLERVRATRVLPRRSMARLYAAAADNPSVTLADFVPPDVPPFEIVRHVGTNSLPLFRSFEKPMYRDATGAIRGRNAQMWSWLVGPGYFTVVEGEDGGDGAVIDYTRLPQRTPELWPRVHSNSRAFSFFVYRELRDAMRRLSEHVTIGKAYRGAGAARRDVGQYFVLVRE